jgi:hypothetical protein
VDYLNHTIAFGPADGYDFWSGREALWNQGKFSVPYYEAAVDEVIVAAAKRQREAAAARVSDNATTAKTTTTAHAEAVGSAAHPHHWPHALPHYLLRLVPYP